MCEKFGGQCECKENIINRQCTECRDGYFGFPNCKKCNCGKKRCDPITGSCICPYGTTGKECDKCIENHYSRNSTLYGCKPCNCNTEGTNGNQTCNSTTGQCYCKADTTSRNCGSCSNGYYNFPQCSPCDCDKSGTNVEICDKADGFCLCKENVKGNRCDQCEPSTFFLEGRNKQGCTRCFCFGRSIKCTSSNMKRTKISSLVDWKLSNDVNMTLVATSKNNSAYISMNNSMKNHTWFWHAPKEYLGNRLASYGGKLTFNFTFKVSSSGNTYGTHLYDIVRIQVKIYFIFYKKISHPKSFSQEMIP